MNHSSQTSSRIDTAKARGLLVLIGLITLGGLAYVNGAPGQGQGNAATATYTTTCTVTVANPTPTATLTNNGPLYATTGKNASGVAGALTWSSTNASSCTGTGFSTGGATSGTIATGVLPSSQSYSVSCNGAVANTTITVITPTATISANPTRVSAGAHSALTWTTSLCTDVTVTGTNGFSSTQPSGTDVDSGAISTHGDTFTVTCDGGSASANVQVTIPPKFDEF